MNPVPILEPVWTQVNETILWLALAHLSVVLFAGSMLMSKAIVPSLVDRNEISQRAARLIPVFYVTALIGFAGLLLFATLFFDDGHVVFKIYDRLWI